jgi:PAS domain S-box-containing protein
LTKIEIPAGVFGTPNLLTEAAKNFLMAVIASSDDAIISKDLNGIISSWNGGARRIFGYEADEIIGQSILRLIPEELHHEEEIILAKLRAGERVDHFETIRVRKSGEKFPVSVTISPVKDDSGVIIGASKIARDISERRRADESRFRLAAIVESADDAIISKDLNGIITSWNFGAQRLFGYKEDEILGQSILRLIPENLRHEEDEILRKVRAGEKIEHYETTRVAKGGEIRQVAVTISPILNSDQVVIGASKIARDVSDRKKVERLAIEADKIATTGRMAAAIAHEINNPLASVLNLIFLVRQGSLSKADTENCLAMAESELERVSHIARQTLGYYRDTGSPSEVHLRDLMGNVLSVYKSKVLTHSIVVDAKYTDLRKISVHPGEIVQIFSNVVSNAIDSMSHGGKLSISITQTKESERNGLQVAVNDTGQGIRREDLDKVFEPFFTTKGNLGTGIGLWVARQLVERHGGQISISSSTGPDDHGTSVNIYLPFIVSEVKSKKANGSESKTEAP